MTGLLSVRARLAGAALAMAAAVGVVHGSHVPIALATGSDAVLRIAFSARPERVEICRTLGDAELEALPAHMRQRTVCEGTTARYHLEVRRDDRVIARVELRGGGLRSDRQLYVFRELAIPSGASDIAVRLVRLDSTASPDTPSSANAAINWDAQDAASARDAMNAGDEAKEERTEESRRRAEGERSEADLARRRGRAEMVPKLLELRERITLAPREVLLVTYDPETRRLLAVRSAP